MNRIKELREARGIQQKELAIDLEVTQPTISNWESGYKIPSARSTQKIADYFGVSIDYLLGRDAEERLASKDDGGSKWEKRLRTLSPSDLALIDRVLSGLEDSPSEMRSALDLALKAVRVAPRVL